MITALNIAITLLPVILECYSYVGKRNITLLTNLNSSKQELNQRLKIILGLKQD